MNEWEELSKSHLHITTSPRSFTFANCDMSASTDRINEPAMAGEEAIRLEQLGRIDGPSDNPHHEFSLPPVDGGKDAWLFLATCFFVEAMVWGKCILLPTDCSRPLLPSSDPR